ncbi:MAG: zinc-ribbon and DUF3426 domain-containing protein [Marinomonas colpomeniae]
MADSLITRCPKCSTAFRVSEEVLSMAKGKVRCGQCFHIFDASKTPNNTEKVTPKKEPITPKKQPLAQPFNDKPLTESVVKAAESESINTTSNSISVEDDTVNPDWLHTLFDDEDLSPIGEQKTLKTKETEDAARTQDNGGPKTSPSNNPDTTKRKARTEQQKQDDLAPWEVELAEVEAALKTSPIKPRQTTTQAAQPKQTKSEAPKQPAQEPDYMVALQSLAQSASEQTRPSDIKNQHSILEQLSAQESLAPLLEENETTTRPKSNHPWMWFFASLLGLALLVGQVAMHFFDEGSRSPNFRSFYQIICSYSGCALPGFEDVSAITTQHVRIQSHPSIPNTLLVNAIITNTSSFSQPMPKIALEFFDLNGAPVAARLFSPSAYLHKDFLDITYMPPNTPIHLVIPIQDPGARAVTHQLKTFPSDTRSY